MSFDGMRGISRRDFVRSAVAIGGSAALSACLERELDDSDGDVTPHQFPQGDGSDTLPTGQHEWNEYLVHGAHGNTVLPEHQVILGLSYVGSVPPTEAERARVESALADLERAVRWGTGGNKSTAINDGLLTMLGYTSRYFDRLDTSVDAITTPEELLEAVDGDPAKADDFDAVLFLTSDHGSIPLAAEAVLWGEEPAFNGVEFEATFEGIFERERRRTGIVGTGAVADEVDHDDVPEDAPLSMGFRSGFADSQPSEDAVTIEQGPFAGGTTAAVSRLHIDLDRWYDDDLETRTQKMFCPAHDPDEIGETADKLGSESSITKEDVERLDEDARERGRVGHSQKVASIRDEENFAPLILRRSEGVATDAAEPVDFNFTSVQRDIEDFVTTRKSMHVEEYDYDVEAEEHGIVDYLETKGRTAILVPPRDRRALPSP